MKCAAFLICWGAGFRLGLYPRNVEGNVKIYNPFLLLDIFWDIDQDRSGSSRISDMKRLVDGLRNIFDVCDQIAVLDQRERGANDIRFLKRVASHHRGRNLSGNGDQRNGIELGIHDTGEQVDGPRSGGCHADPGLPRDAGIARRRKRAALFVPGQNHTDFFALGECLMDFHRGPAGIAEKHLTALIFKSSDDDVPALHGLLGFFGLVDTDNFFRGCLFGWHSR